MDYVEQDPNIAIGLRGIQLRQATINENRAYMDCSQPDVFDKKRWEGTFPNTRQPRDNLIALIVRTARARLRPLKFVDVDTAATDISIDNPVGTTAGAASIANFIWQDNLLDQHANEAHTEALSCADAWVSVGIKPDGNVGVYPRRADEGYVEYDQELPGHRLWGITVFRLNDNRTRVNCHYPDKQTRWISSGIPGFELPGGVASGITVIAPSAEGMFVPYTEDGGDFEIPNPMGEVNLFHLPCDAPLGRYGRAIVNSSLKSLQDAVHLMLAEMLVVGFNAAFPQNVFSGVVDNPLPTQAMPIPLGGDLTPPGPPTEVTPRVQTGSDRILTLANDNAKVWQFAAADMAQYILTLDSVRLEMARTSQTPAHQLTLNTGNFPSGEALKTAEAPGITAANERQTVLGNAWEQIMSFAVRAQMSHNPDGTFRALAPRPMLSLEWEPAETQYELTPVERVTALISAGATLEYIMVNEMGVDPDVAAAVAEQVKAAKQQAATIGTQLFSVGALDDKQPA